MKKKLKLLIIAALLISAPVILFAQGPGEPPHPNSGATPNGGSNIPVGGAPIDGGLGILLALGAAYGFRKMKKSNEKGLLM